MVLSLKLPLPGLQFLAHHCKTETSKGTGYIVLFFQCQTLWLLLSDLTLFRSVPLDPQSLPILLFYFFLLLSTLVSGILRWLGGKESTCQCRRHRFYPWVGKIPKKRKWQPILVFFPGESCGQRSLVGYQPWVGCSSWVAKSRTRLSTHTRPCIQPHLLSLAWTPDCSTLCCFISNIYLTLSELNHLFMWRPRLTKQNRVTLQSIATKGFLNPQSQIKGFLLFLSGSHSFTYIRTI